MKNKKTNILILLVVTGLVLYFALSSDFEGIIDVLSKMNVFYVILACLLMFGYLFLRSIVLHKLIIKFEPNYKYRKTLKLKLSTQFFNAITPFASGGQPFQIYSLKMDGISIGNGTNIIIQNFIIYQIALIIMGIIAIVSNYFFHMFPKVGVLRELVLIGFMVNSLVTIFLFLLTFSKKLKVFLVNKGIALLSKIGIIKNKEELINKWMERIETFNIGAHALMSNKFQFAFFVFLDILALCSLYLVPLMVLYGTGDFTSFNGFQSIVGVSYVMLIGSFVPIPGGTGGLEYGFTKFFGNFITSSKLMAIMLTWRFVTYYLGLFVGAIAVNIKTKE